MKTESNERQVDEVLSRGVASFVDPDGSLRKKLIDSPSEVVIKFGVDPTRPDIHLGHAVIFRALRQFQNLGCKVVFLIGDLTAQIGDPSGQSKVRPEIDRAEIEANMKTYLDQVGKILSTDNKVFSWIRNSDWYIGITDLLTPEGHVVEIEGDGQKITSPPLQANHILAKTDVWQKSRMQKGQIRNYSLLNFISILRTITHQRLISRDMFQDRIKEGKELYMHEMMYPVLQGIDSSALGQIYGSCDLEVGGTDQTFNMLMGRDVMKISGQPQQAVLSFEILTGLDGKEKMSKSLDNYVAITDEPNDMYGKIMSLPDELIPKYFELCTYTPLEAIEGIKKILDNDKENPRDIKMRLAREIVEMYHGRDKSIGAEKFFVDTFSKGVIPESIPEVEVKKGIPLVDVLVENELVSSKSDFRRLVESKSIELMETGTIVESSEVLVEEAGTYRIGKKRFIKILLS